MNVQPWKRALTADIHQRSDPGSVLLALHVAPALRAPKLKKMRGSNISSSTPMAAQPTISIHLYTCEESIF